MLCGLYALNALLLAADRAADPYTQNDLDRLNAEVHRRERELCAEAGDTAPDRAGGNYPLEVLLLALQRRGLRASFHHRHRCRPTMVADRGRAAVGYLVGNGRHYVAVVRAAGTAGWTTPPTADADDAGRRWVVVDDGTVRGSAADPPDAADRPPDGLLERLGGPSAVVIAVSPRQPAGPRGGRRGAGGGSAEAPRGSGGAMRRSPCDVTADARSRRAWPWP